MVLMKNSVNELGLSFLRVKYIFYIEYEKVYKIIFFCFEIMNNARDILANSFTVNDIKVSIRKCSNFSFISNTVTESVFIVFI